MNAFGESPGFDPGFKLGERDKGKKTDVNATGGDRVEKSLIF